ncbi:CRTAC1 family protein [Porticoccus sp. W117]|uniref:CRTAC1 family protein n=1 Tax=Porticoccus sp. W117 TaxID=3054777 RepID=UPI002599C570|nr:CRTAC1 family protein [Porticoccus sp. W117]MDM3870362.1 CRTAC1 family protein [Porticoccus sp. W117]
MNNLFAAAVAMALWVGCNGVNAESNPNDTASNHTGHHNKASVSITFQPFQKPSPAGGTLFTRMEGSQVGIPYANILTSAQFSPPWWNGRGVASGDIDRDGFIDIVLATGSGIQIYLNRSTNKAIHFERQPLSLPDIDSLDVFAAALVDINNDGWLDLFLTSYMKGNRIVLNTEGEFLPASIQTPPASPLHLTAALGFGDVDNNGYLDVAQGNWFMGHLKPKPPAASDNQLLLNDGQSFSVQPLKGITGETQSLLLTDFTGDHNLDLMVGNDFEAPDYYYQGNGKGELTPILSSDGRIPHSTATTMSMDTADFDNDLDMDIYAAQIAASATGESTRLPTRPWAEYCALIMDKVVRQGCENAVAQRQLFNFGPKFQPNDILQCKTLTNDDDKKGCMATMLMLAAIRTGDKRLCQRIPAGQEALKTACEHAFMPSSDSIQEAWQQAIPVTANTNVLLQANADGRFTDQAKELGIPSAGWSWTATFADFDNDQWQDIFAVNGDWMQNRGTPAKVFFHNQQGKGFVDKANEFGLQNHMIQSAYTKFDADNDGDLDLLVNSVNGPMWFYRNNQQANHSVVFELRDELGNYFGLGSKVIIRYGSGKHQLREIKAGGGFLSFDPPVAHFGLGDYRHIQSVEVIWSTGETTVLNEGYRAGGKYVIRRQR